MFVLLSQVWVVEMLGGGRMSEGKCAVCGSDCEELHSMSVLVEGIGKRGRCGVRNSELICTQCNALLTYDPWGDSNYQTDSEGDRVVLKILSATLLGFAVEGLRALREESHAVPA